MDDVREPRGEEIVQLQVPAHRQVSPACWLQDGRPSSQVFKPRSSDHGLLSLTHGCEASGDDNAPNEPPLDGKCRSARGAWEFATTTARLVSVGVLTLTVGDFHQAQPGASVRVYADPCTKVDDGFDDPAHLVADFRALSRGQTDKLASALRRIAGALSYAPPPLGPT
jgi:hypothetical protein